MQQDCVEALNKVPHDERAVAVSACGDGGLICEQCQVSKYSPGIVGNEEELYLLVKDPNHLIQDGRLHPGLFAGIFSRGLSVLRQNAEDIEFTRTALLISGPPEGGNMLHGVAQFHAQDVRSMNDARFMTVFDTGYADRPHHADIFQPNPMAIPGSTARMKRQKALREQIGPNIAPIRDFKAGLLAAYARPEVRSQ